MEFKPKTLQFTWILHYLALILGLIASVFFTFFLLADGIGDLLEAKLSVIPIMCMMIIAVLGYVWTFWKPKRGGLVMITGGIIMTVYLLLLGGFGEFKMALIFGFPFIIPGLIFYFNWREVKYFNPIDF
jgi:hypothetical protein